MKWHLPRYSPGCESVRMCVWVGVHVLGFVREIEGEGGEWQTWMGKPEFLN